MSKQADNDEVFTLPRIVDFFGSAYVRPCYRGIELRTKDGATPSLESLIIDGIREHYPNFNDGDVRLAIDIRLLPSDPADKFVFDLDNDLDDEE